jgi:hypothetical protein
MVWKNAFLAVSLSLSPRLSVCSLFDSLPPSLSLSLSLPCFLPFSSCSHITEVVGCVLRSLPYMPSARFRYVRSALAQLPGRLGEAFSAASLVRAGLVPAAANLLLVNSSSEAAPACWGLLHDLLLAPAAGSGFAQHGEERLALKERRLSVAVQPFSLSHACYLSLLPCLSPPSLLIPSLPSGSAG